jgi:hypothetical protein
MICFHQLTPQEKKVVSKKVVPSSTEFDPQEIMDYLAKLNHQSIASRQVFLV